MHQPCVTGEITIAKPLLASQSHILHNIFPLQGILSRPQISQSLPGKPVISVPLMPLTICYLRAGLKVLTRTVFILISSSVFSNTDEVVSSSILYLLLVLFNNYKKLYLLLPFRFWLFCFFVFIPIFLITDKKRRENSFNSKKLY